MKSQSKSEARSQKLESRQRQENQDSRFKIQDSKRKLKVFVGLSGGVDSAVSAALLKKATPNNFQKLFSRPTPEGFNGFDVTGVFIRAWTPFDSPQGKPKYACTWKEDRRSAMRVAAVLDIPFITLDLEKEYKREVVDYMISEYKKGRTPNPDVMCNKEIKFGHFLKFALENGADFVATGHYARKREIPNYKLQIPNTSKIQNNKYEYKYQLSEGADKNKDQSYFLWTLTQEQLKHVLFPVGHLQKTEVRKLAKKFGLPQETRKDSQGLCFLGKIDMKEFLKDYIKPKKGNVLLASHSFNEAGNEKEEVIGYHNGALFFTIGERHGFTLTSKNSQGSPVYVVAKDIEKNTITVAPKTDIGIISNNKYKINKVLLTNLNINEDDIFKIKKLTCRFRYRQEKVSCKIVKLKKETAEVEFLKPQEAVASGQSLVFYNGEVCLGGGVIEI